MNVPPDAVSAVHVALNEDGWITSYANTYSALCRAAPIMHAKALREAAEELVLLAGMQAEASAVEALFMGARKLRLRADELDGLIEL